MRILFTAYAGDTHSTKICRLVKRELQRMNPKTTAKIIEIEKKRLSYLENILDKNEIYFVKEVIKHFNPDVIVVTLDTGIQATFIKIARMMKIPTLNIQIGLTAERKDRFPILRLLKWNNYLLWRFLSLLSNLSFITKLTTFIGWRTRAPAWGLGGAEMYAVMGARYKRLLASRGVAPHQIKITGYPLLDEVYHKPKMIKREVMRQLGLKENTPVVLFLSQSFVEHGYWTIDEQIKFIESVIRAVRLLNYMLIIKLHPGESIENYDSVIRKESSERVVFVKNFDLNRLISISDVVVTVSSTAGLWALAHGRPLVIITSFKERLGYMGCSPLEEMAITVHDLKDLPQVLKSLTGSNEQKLKRSQELEKKIREHVYRIDGKASRRIAKLIISLAKK